MKPTSPKAIFEMLKETYAEWSEDKASRLAAALAYYTVFSIAPMLVVIIAITGLAFDQTEARDLIIKQIHQFSHSDEMARQIKEMIDKASTPKASIWATIISLAIALGGAAGLFGQLQDSLNTIWEVAPKPGQGILATLKARFLSFAMVLGTGFLLLVSFVLSAALAALGKWMEGFSFLPPQVLQVMNFVISFAIITLLFAMIYKVLPDVEISYRDVWLGAAMTSLLFTIGKFALGLYLGRAGVTSAYGAAGSLILILLWIYYAAQILFFGAEFTQIYAAKYGSKILPSPNAVPVTEEARAKQGMPRKEHIEGAAAGENWEAGTGASSVFWPGGATPAQAATAAPAKPDFEYLIAVLLGFISILLLFGGGRSRD